MQDQFKLYIDKLEQSLKIRNLATGTIINTCWKLSKFTAWLIKNNILTIDNITKDAVQSYQIELYQKINAKGKQNSAGYQNSMLSAVKQFTKFLHEQNHIVSDPARHIQYAKTPKMLPRGILTPTEARRIIHAPDIRTSIGYRDRVILEVLYTSGVRKKEINSLTLN
ncbi:MAG: site-specific integrase, partial [Desulfobacteraceae bacterium]|nr:site-specific integrase [Desulfobacteraceae bacterium]